MSEAAIAFRPLRNLLRQEIVGLPRLARRGRDVLLRLHARPSQRQDAALDTGSIHGRKPHLAEVGQAAVEVLPSLRRQVDYGRGPILLEAGAQAVLLDGNLFDHALHPPPELFLIGLFCSLCRGKRIKCQSRRASCAVVARIERSEMRESPRFRCAQPGLSVSRGIAVAKKIRGVAFEENLNNSMGLEFHSLSHRFGYQSPNWPYFEDVKIERIHYHAKSGVLSQRITTSMHNTTHIDAPAHVIQGTAFIDEVPLPHFFGSGIVVSIPKKKWEPITYDDLEKAAGSVVRPRDVVIVNTGWHKFYDDNEDYFCRAPGFVPSAGEWFVEKKVKVVGHDTQANDHPLATAIGPQRNGPLHPHLAEEYKQWSGGRDWKQDFPDWEPVHRILFKNGILGIENVGGDIDKVTGRRCTFALFPWNWERGDGCIIRLVAIIDPTGGYRIERGDKF